MRSSFNKINDKCEVRLEADTYKIIITGPMAEALYNLSKAPGYGGEKTSQLINFAMRFLAANTLAVMSPGHAMMPLIKELAKVDALINKIIKQSKSPNIIQA